MILSDYLGESFAKEYCPGTWDCALFVAGWVDSLTGQNRTGDFAGRYKDKTEGLHRFGPLRRRVEHELGLLGFTLHEQPREGDIATMRGGLVGIVTNVGERLGVTLVMEDVGGFLTLKTDAVKGFYRWEE